MSPAVMPTRILVVGGGGREHALAWKLSDEPGVNLVVVAPGSDAIGELPRVQCVEVPAADQAAIVDVARAKGHQKRGGGAVRVTFDDALVVTDQPGQDLVALDDALEALAAVDERKARVIELRFFGGLSIEETAEVMKTSPRTVRRDWNLAKAWLYRELRGVPDGPSAVE